MSLFKQYEPIYGVCLSSTRLCNSKCYSSLPSDNKDDKILNIDVSWKKNNIYNKEYIRLWFILNNRYYYVLFDFQFNF